MFNRTALLGKKLVCLIGLGRERFVTLVDVSTSVVTAVVLRNPMGYKAVSWLRPG